MHIYFIGQKGIQPLRIHDSAEVRTDALAHEAIKNGHTVTVACTTSYTKQQLLHSSAINLLRFPSLNPNIPGGYLYTALSCIAALRIKPDTIHVQGWRAGIIIRMLLPFMRKSTIIWTISELPSFSTSLFHSLFQRALPFIATRFTTICTPSRTIQYRLLTLYSLKSEYIPDGYSASTLPDLRPALFGLRKEQYGIVISDNSAQLKQISKEYKTLKSKKKLVALSPTKHTGVTALNLPLSSRSVESLIRQAAFIITTNPSYYPLLLQAMDSGRTIIATTNPLHEELFGTTAQYYEINDSIQLQKLLKNTQKKHVNNNSAQIRAKNHFSWNKIGQEYGRAYRHSKAVLVPFDSIIAKNSFQRAV
jgi:hypothetical protein